MGESDRFPESRDYSVSPGIGPIMPVFDMGPVHESVAPFFQHPVVRGAAQTVAERALARGMAYFGTIGLTLYGSYLLYRVIGELGIPRGSHEEREFMFEFVEENPQTYPLFKHHFPLLF